MGSEMLPQSPGEFDRVPGSKSKNLPQGGIFLYEEPPKKLKPQAKPAAPPPNRPPIQPPNKPPEGAEKIFSKETPAPPDNQKSPDQEAMLRPPANTENSPANQDDNFNAK